MYVPKPSEFAAFDRRRVSTFVKYWTQFYGHGPKHLDGGGRIDYETEINIAGNLTRNNIRNLLRWKDPRYLTHINLGEQNSGALNSKVVDVLTKQRHLNQFRNGEIDESMLQGHLDQIFPTGIIYRAFLFHISRPFDYPIADQHVFRAFRYHTGMDLPDNWEKYDLYKQYFFDLADQLPPDNCSQMRLRSLKSLDSALMMFGQFLSVYGQDQ